MRRRIFGVTAVTLNDQSAGRVVLGCSKTDRGTVGLNDHVGLAIVDLALEVQTRRTVGEAISFPQPN